MIYESKNHLVNNVNFSNIFLFINLNNYYFAKEKIGKRSAARVIFYGCKVAFMQAMALTFRARNFL